MNSAERKKFEEPMSRFGTVQNGVCPKHGLVKLTIIHKNRSLVFDDHRFYGVCEHNHEWELARFS